MLWVLDLPADMVTTNSRPIISDRHTGALLEQCVANTLIVRFRWLSTTYRHLNIFTLLGTALTLVILVPTYFALFHSFLTLVLDRWSSIWFACSSRTFLDDFLRLLRLLMPDNFHLIFPKSYLCIIIHCLWSAALVVRANSTWTFYDWPNCGR